MQISNLISKIQTCLENNKISGSNSKEEETTSALSDNKADETVLKYIESSSSLTFKELEEAVYREELKDLSAELISELNKMLEDGKMTQENFNEVNSILSGGITLAGIKKLNKAINKFEEPQTQKVFKESGEIAEALGNLDGRSYSSVLNKTDGISSIKSIEIASDGTYKISTKDNSSILLSESGRIVQTYDNKYKTGFDT